MIAKNQNQPLALESGHRRYLIINPEEVLDPVVTPRKLEKDDLLIELLEPCIFSVLKDGKRIAEFLEKLTTEQRYSIILNTNRKEYQIIHAFKSLDKACKRVGFKEFLKYLPCL